MIDYNPKNWFRGIFAPHSSGLMRKLIWNILAIGLYTTTLVYLLMNVLELETMMNMGIHKLLGIVLGLVLVFRTNTAYDRWWEGRKLWGALVNRSRSLSAKLDAMLPDQDKASRAFFASSISNFAFALKEHLRNGVKFEEFKEDDFPHMDTLINSDHVPNSIVRIIQQRLKDMLSNGEINGDEFLALSFDTDGLINVLGGTERIKKTPIPYSYGSYIKKVIFIYVTTLPFGFTAEFGYWTIPAVMFVFYVLVGIELIAEEVEDPFGLDANDLDTDSMSVTIRKNVEEILGV